MILFFRTVYKQNLERMVKQDESHVIVRKLAARKSRVASEIADLYDGLLHLTIPSLPHAHMYPVSIYQSQYFFKVFRVNLKKSAMKVLC